MCLKKRHKERLISVTRVKETKELRVLETVLSFTSDLKKQMLKKVTTIKKTTVPDLHTFQFCVRQATVFSWEDKMYSRILSEITKNIFYAT